MSKSHQSPYHVLDFFIDDEDNSALTVLSRGIRFHIIADTEKLGCRSGEVEGAAREYLRLVQNVKSLDAGQKEDKDTADSDEDASPSTDSGVDVSAPGTTGSLHEAEDAVQRWMMSFLASDLKNLAPTDQEPAHPTVHEWYDCPTHFFNLEAGKDGLHAVELEGTRDLQDRMQKLIPELSIPKYIRDLDVPWYLASDLTVLSCSDELAAYHPCRVRLRDSNDDKTYFLKLVDEPGPNKREIRLLDRVAKLGLHSELRCPKLEALISFSSPSSKGFSKTTILGFLQTDIKNPTPLTKKLDPSIPQKQREEWADEADRMKALLHDKGIVWGDAKADNFMVDEDDKLWIIDFGGSYTEGWVDKELNETEEGDDMGVMKIVNALEDPVANTMDSDDEEEGNGDEVDQPAATRKRKATDDLSERVSNRQTKTPRLFVTQPSSEPEDSEKEAEQTAASSEAVELGNSSNYDSTTPASQPSDQEEDQLQQQQEYCYCHKPASDDMIACDNAECSNQWFHFECAGITSAPPTEQEWYCTDCADS